MKFKPEIAGTALPPEVLEQDYAQAENMDGLQLGEDCLFFRKLFGATYLPYSQIVRAWLRQEEVKARMCCSTANFDQFYVVTDCTDGRQRRGHVADKASGQACLDHITCKNPNVSIGFSPPAQ